MSHFQGNSNSLATVDVASGYTGLDDYRPILVGLQMCLCTYAGPIFWSLALMEVFAETYDSKRYKQILRPWYSGVYCKKVDVVVFCSICYSFLFPIPYNLLFLSISCVMYLLFLSICYSFLFAVSFYLAFLSTCICYSFLFALPFCLVFLSVCYSFLFAVPSYLLFLFYSMCTYLDKYMDTCMDI